MFGFFKKSPETIVDTLYPLTTEIARSIATRNYLQITPGTAAHARFTLGSLLFSNLLCWHLFSTSDDSSDRSLRVGVLLGDRLIAEIAPVTTPQMRITEVIVWDDELNFFHRLNPRLIGVDSIPFATIVSQLLSIRYVRMLGDLQIGAQKVAQEGAWSRGLLMPACSSLIMQTIVDYERASDDKTIFGFASSLTIPFVLLTRSIEAALK